MYENPRECSLEWPEYCKKTCAILRDLCPNFPLCIVRDPHHCGVLWLGMDLGNEDGSLLQDFRAVCPMLMACGFFQDSSIIKSWDRSTRACPHRGPCPLLLQLYDRRQCKTRRWEMWCTQAWLPLWLCRDSAVSHNEPATPSAFLMDCTKSLVFYYWWPRFL